METLLYESLPFSVDRWAQADSRPAFLTHAHKDHCLGIEARPRHLYCTTVTKDLVVNKYPSLAAQMTWTTLCIGQTLQLEAEGIRFSVTALDAAHCPGACMFLFHSPAFGTLLHTGDTRLGSQELSKVKAALTALQLSEDLDEYEQGIDMLVLDCTFGEESQEFPSRQESLTQLSHVLNTSTSQRVYVCAEGLGSEDIIQHIHTAHGQRVYVAPLGSQPTTPGGMELRHAHWHTAALHEERVRELGVLQRHGIIPEGALSTDSSCRVHLIGGRRLKALGAHCAPRGIPVIKLSTQKWCMPRHEAAAGVGVGGPVGSRKRGSPGEGSSRGGGMTRGKAKPTCAAQEDGCLFILHSMHSSRSELITALHTLQPRAVIPHSGSLPHCVMPAPDQQNQLITETIDRLASHKDTRPTQATITTCWPSPCKSPGRLGRAGGGKATASVMGDGGVSGVLCGSPRSSKRARVGDACDGVAVITTVGCPLSPAHGGLKHQAARHCEAVAAGSPQLLHGPAYSHQHRNPLDTSTACAWPVHGCLSPQCAGTQAGVTGVSQSECYDVCPVATHHHITYGPTHHAGGSKGWSRYDSVAEEALLGSLSLRQYKASVMLRMRG